MFRISAWAVGVLLIPTAVAAGTAADTDPSASGVLPGDETLTCEQIYAQGMAESQRDQQARSQRNDQMRKEQAATGALITGGMLTGGMGGTGQAANAAAQSQADKTMAMLGPQQTNPRMDHLKELWAQKHCAKK
jgi:hypothetical protein